MPHETPTEIAEREVLKTWITEHKIHTFEYLDSMARADAALLTASGYKDHADAFLKIMKRAASDLEKKIVAHERKFPH